MIKRTPVARKKLTLAIMTKIVKKQMTRGTMIMIISGIVVIKRKTKENTEIMMTINDMSTIENLTMTEEIVVIEIIETMTEAMTEAITKIGNTMKRRITPSTLIQISESIISMTLNFIKLLSGKKSLHMSSKSICS